MPQITLTQLSKRTKTRAKTRLRGLLPLIVEAEATPTGLYTPYDKRQWLKLSEPERVAHVRSKLRAECFDVLVKTHTIIDDGDALADIHGMARSPRIGAESGAKPFPSPPPRLDEA